MTMSIKQRHKRLLDMVAEGRLLRGAWQRFDSNGDEHACLLVALAPEADTGVTKDCPTEVMPHWLAEITPWIDDKGSKEAWPGVVRQYTNLMIASQGFGPREWRRLEAAWFLVVLKKIRPYYPTAVDRVSRLWQQVAAGNEPESAEWSEAEETAKKAEWATEKVVEDRTAWTARTAAAAYPEMAAAAAIDVEEATWMVVVTKTIRTAARAEAADRIIFAFFDAWQTILEDMQ